ncbi:MAG: dimethyl sulfoxide reductase anchor subunit family protein, partial [Verrucomicrobiales bacterium]
APTPSFLPSAPHQDYTVPTTAYVSDRGVPPHARAADRSALRPQHPHWPLVWMLTLTQISVGLACVAAIGSQPSLPLSVGAALSGFIGLGASVLHLGRPLKAWRAFLGLGHSWLSREIFAFGGYAPLLGIALGIQFSGLPFGSLYWGLTALAGMGAVFTSVMIYHDTRRPFWSFPRTFTRFYGTVLLLFGAGLILADQMIYGGPMLLLSAICKLASEGYLLRLAGSGTDDPDSQSARIQTQCTRSALFLRWSATLIGISLLFSSPILGIPAGLLGIAALSAGEVAERYLFFTAVYAPKMPGGVSA